jgi:hypothetical protein
MAMGELAEGGRLRRSLVSAATDSSGMERRDELLRLVITALALADELGLTDIGIDLDKARVSLAETPVSGLTSIAFH